MGPGSRYGESKARVTRLGLARGDSGYGDATPQAGGGDPVVQPQRML
jgi:hypothetical protein